MILYIENLHNYIDAQKGLTIEEIHTMDACHIGFIASGVDSELWREGTAYAKEVAIRINNKEPIIKKPVTL